MMLYNNKNDCCGCSACANICPANAIDMIEDNEGFEFPQINKQNCINCKLCQKVCPIKTSIHKENLEMQKKHIGIINLQYTNNYGAIIAAAVLEDITRSIVGSDYIVNTINYIPNKNFNNKLLKIFDNVKQWGGWKLYLKALFPKTTDNSSKSKRSKRFEIFKNNFLNLSPMYQSASDINSNIRYSAFITGSDIVWAPKKTDNFRADGYYLRFANKGELKIAYAPSLDNAVNKKLLKIKDKYKSNIQCLDFISVREKSNIAFIQSLTDKKVYQCCDPAFLVDADYYDKMIETSVIIQNNEKYIYVYILEINQEIVDYANKLSKEKGLKICYYSANHSNYEGASEDCTADGPAEFLHRLKNAEYVLTNSFHCVVFSLLFKKKFLSFIRSDVSVKSIDLLDDLNLSNRIANRNNNIDDEINFAEVEKKLSEIRESSLSYLKMSLDHLN